MQAGEGGGFSSSCHHAGPENHHPGSSYLAAPTHPILGSVALVILCCKKRKTKRNPVGVHTPRDKKKKKAQNMVEKKQEKIKEKITDRRHGVMLVSHPRQQVASGARTSPLTESSAGALGPCLQAVRA